MGTSLHDRPRTASQLPRDDAEIIDAIKRAQAGDEAAFEIIYCRYKQRVINICRRMVGNTGEVEELTQDVFLQVFRKLSQFRGESKFSTWLHRVTICMVLMELRKRKGFTISLDEFLEADPEKPKKEIESVDMRLKISPEMVSIHNALRRLAPGYRMVLILHDIKGFQHREIAEILSCSMGNSKSQLHKAREKMRELLGIEKPS